MAEKLIKRGEVYWVKLPDEKGHELKDPHMGLVISNDKQNIFSTLITIIPITSLKEGDKVYPFQVPTYFQSKKGVMLVDQIRTIDRKRFNDLVDRIDEEMMEKVERALHLTLALKK
jgi:mRNA interferase MazF